VRRGIAVAVIAFTLSGCRSTTEPGRRSASPSASPSAPVGSPAEEIAIGRAPAWIREYCADAGRVVESPVLCPAQAPVGILPTGNLQVLRPAPEGYVFEGEADTHWVFSASPGPIEGDYGPMLDLGVATIGGETGTWLSAPESAGIHASHLVLTWRSGEFHYVVSAHTDDPSSQALRRGLVTVASAMRVYR
jgi:hypothetical protein